ncbi:MAG: aminotransferase class IV [Eubacteriales bacterium]|nr:aminotransferase class IV [Eubacteriales bacterium]
MLIVNGTLQIEGHTFEHGAFTTLAVLQQPLWLDRHLARLNQTARFLGLTRQVRAGEIRKLIQIHQIKDTALKIIISADNLVLVTRPLPEDPTLVSRLWISPLPHPEQPPLASHKTLNRCGYALGQEQAITAGFTDVLWLGQANEVLETAGANIVAIMKNTLVTPPLDGRILPGIVREIVIDRAHKISGLTVLQRPLRLDEMMHADAIFLTNSLIGIRQVVAIGDQPLDQTHQDNLQKLQQAYQAAVRAEDLRCTM